MSDEKRNVNLGTLYRVSIGLSLLFFSAAHGCPNQLWQPNWPGQPWESSLTPSDQFFEAIGRGYETREELRSPGGRPLAPEDGRGRLEGLKPIPLRF